MTDQAHISVQALASSLAQSEARAEQRHVELLAATVCAGMVRDEDFHLDVGRALAWYAVDIAREIIRQNREVKP